MGENESEIKMNDITDRLADLASDMNTILYGQASAFKSLKDLEERVIRMERAFDALGRRLEGSERHVEDEGWFD